MVSQIRECAKYTIKENSAKYPRIRPKLKRDQDREIIKVGIRLGHR